MKKIYTLIFILACFHFANATNPVPNSDFASWTSGNPDEWTTDNTPGTDTPVVQVSPGYNSTYAAEGQVVQVNSMSIQYPAAPTLYSISNSNPSGFPITQPYNNLEFYYKSNLVGSDKFETTVYIYNSQLQTIGTGLAYITGNASGFTVMEVTISYTSNDAPAAADIEFTISDNSGYHLGSYFIVDDVSLNMVAGVNNINGVLGSYSVFPNPASNNLIMDVNLTSSQKVEIKLYNILGAEVGTPELYMGKEGDNRFEIDVQNLPQGIYFARITLNGVLSSTREFIVSR